MRRDFRFFVERAQEWRFGSVRCEFDGSVWLELGPVMFGIEGQGDRPASWSTP